MMLHLTTAPVMVDYFSGINGPPTDGYADMNGQGHNDINTRIDLEFFCLYKSTKVLPVVKEKLTTGKMVYNVQLAWWKAKCVNCPIMASLAMTLLCIPATSAPSERLFSDVTDTRATVKMLLCWFS